ncbi:MAG: hypothetical protein ACRENE_04360 [Polyangiaceae bacterium]
MRRFSVRDTRWLPCVALCAALLGCASGVTFVYQHYDGPPQPAHRIAILRETGTSPTLIVAVDGKQILAPLERQNRLHIEVLPGLHEVDVAAPDLGLRHTIPIRMLAAAGKVYRVEVSGGPTPPPQPDNGEPPLEVGQWVAHTYEVDRDTDAPQGIADAPVPVTAAPSPAAPPTAPPAAVAAPAPAPSAMPALVPHAGPP